MAVPPDVERHAPRLHLHPEEAYPPMHPDRWLEAARLCWVEGGVPKTLADQASTVFGADGHPADFTHDGHRLAEVTRPWQGDQRDSGFVVTTGAPATFTRVEQPVPVFYDYVEGAYVTYWLFYPWSTVPRAVPGPPSGLEEVEAGTVDPDVAVQGLLEAYPGLMQAAAPGGAMEISVHDALRYVQDWLGSKWPVMHEGDWEGIAVSLRDDDRRVAYFQHGGNPQMRPIGVDERPHLYSALGSHASYPDVDGRSEGSSRVKLVERLQDGPVLEIELIDVRSMPWYGFGGAWGSAGRISDETGPLGPCDAKGPRPFA